MVKQQVYSLYHLFENYVWLTVHFKQYTLILLSTAYCKLWNIPVTIAVWALTSTVNPQRLMGICLYSIDRCSNQPVNQIGASTFWRYNQNNAKICIWATYNIGLNVWIPGQCFYRFYYSWQKNNNAVNMHINWLDRN